MNNLELIEEVTNFIEYYTSNDDERNKMTASLRDYIAEVREEPREVMVFTFDVRKGQDIYWKKAVMDVSPTAEYIPAEELHLWVAKYRAYGWKVKVN